MPATADLHALGQSIWLDNITRKMLDDGVIQRYIDEYSVTGLTSNPSIFDKAIAAGHYDDAIRVKAAAGVEGEALFFELAIEDLRRAADLFLGAHDRTAGVDGWVSLEVSPELAYDATATVAAATELHARAGRRNLFIKIPGTPEGLPAITESIAAGVPVNVTLLFDAAQYRAAADAFMTGIERRIDAGLDPAVGSVASVFMSRWDKAVADVVPDGLRNRLALAVGLDVYRAYREVLDSERWQRLEGQGARAQRLLWVRDRPGRPEHGEHHARRDARGVPRPRVARGRDAGRRRRRRRAAGRVRRRRGRREGAGGHPPGRRRAGVRGVVAGPAQAHRRADRRGGLSPGPGARSDHR
jgi:transaldolase